MTRNQDIRVSDTLGWGEHGVQSSNRSPIGKEVTLVVMCPRVITEIVGIVDRGRERKFVSWGVGDDTGICKTRDGDLTFLQLRT